MSILFGSALGFSVVFITVPFVMSLHVMGPGMVHSADPVGLAAYLDLIGGDLLTASSEVNLAATSLGAPRSKSLVGSPSGESILNHFRKCRVTRSLGTMYPEDAKADPNVLVNTATQTLIPHIWKNAGTAIESAAHAVGYDWTHVLHSWTLLRNSSWFRAAIVRDPFDRALSAFHEHWKRLECGHTAGAGKCKTVLPGMKAEWLTMFRDAMVQQKQCFALGAQGMPYQDIWKKGYHECLDAHYFPQVGGYLADPRGTKNPMDYLGTIDRLGEELAFIFQVPHVQTTVMHGPSKDSDTPFFRLKKEDIPDDVQRMVCDVYRDDYCCLGFAPPTACGSMSCST